MFYREVGEFKSTYAADQVVFPIRQDRYFVWAVVLFAFVGVPLIANPYWFSAILIPFLILSLAALGLNLLVGYCGQISLGTGGFMAVGAYAAYNLTLRVPGINPLVAFLLAGGIATIVGILFGIPSLRIKGFYLAVATLAAQFFLDWVFSRIAWFTNYTPSGSISAPELNFFGFIATTPLQKYLVALSFVTVLALVAKNLVRGNLGRQWMAIRDMDIAAEIMGIRPFYAKLTAFAVSSFFVGVAGALWAFVHLGSWEPLAFSIDRSNQLLFMIIIGGLGSILGSFLGAAFILIMPIMLDQLPHALGIKVSVETVSHLVFIITGALICFLLIKEPHGFAKLWSLAKEKLRLWPFPY